MDRSYIDRHLVIDRYLLGKLADDELAEFEERLVWDRELVDEVELAEKLQAGLQASAEDDRFTGGAGLVERLGSAMSMTRFAAAASFVFGVGLTALFMNNADIPDGPDLTTPTTVMPLHVVRGADVQTIPVSRTGLIVLMVDVPPAYPAFRVSVSRQGDAEPFWAQDGLTPGYTQAVAVGIPAEALTPGPYTLAIMASDAEAVEFRQEIPFRAIAAE